MKKKLTASWFIKICDAVCDWWSNSYLEEVYYVIQNFFPKHLGESLLVPNTYQALQIKSVTDKKVKKT